MDRRFSLTALVALGVLASCGSSSSTDGTGGSSSGGASTGGASSGGATTGGAAGTAAGGAAGSTLGGTGGGGGVDAGGDASDGGPTVQDAGMFDCGGCGCDGATHYCVSIAAGVEAFKPFGTGECLDVTAPGSEGCHPLPSACAGIPSCGCLPSPMPGAGNACHCDDVGGGLSYNCALP